MRSDRCSDVAVHLCAAALFILAFFGTIVHILHRADRHDLRLGHAPGTIASAVSIGAQTNVGEMLSGRQNEEEIDLALRDKRFKIDPRTNKVRSPPAPLLFISASVLIGGCRL